MTTHDVYIKLVQKDYVFMVKYSKSTAAIQSWEVEGKEESKG